MPQFKKIIRDKIQNKNLKTQINDREHQRFINDALQNTAPHISYASALKGNPRMSQQDSTGKPTNKIKELLDRESMANFGCDYATLDRKFVDFMADYSGSNDVDERRMALFNFIFEIRFNV